ncbi:MAG: hypothetical protein JWO12_1117 [Frankiales bacterium]|nr:hypothetical protein [Frankiales bacterium]
MERVNPPFVADERSMLMSWLDFHRHTLRIKCEGLTDEQMKLRSVEPSTLTLLGLVRHCAKVEQSWARRCLEQQEVVLHYSTAEHPDGDFDLVDDADVAEALATWETEWAHADEVMAAMALDDTGVRHGQPCSVRWVLVHLIEEYARHNGHADLLRERIDGRTGD